MRSEHVERFTGSQGDGYEPLLAVALQGRRRVASARPHLCHVTPVSRSLREPHSANTNSMVWLRISFSSGVSVRRPLEIWLSPDMIATYCLLPTSKVMGGALKPDPTLNVHSSCMLSSS